MKQLKTSFVSKGDLSTDQYSKRSNRELVLQNALNQQSNGL